MPLVRGLNGNYYGMTFHGGTAGRGTVFEMTPLGVTSILHSFVDGSVANDGFNPSSLMQTPDGTLYGTTSQGGTSYPSAGTIFKITTQGVYSIVYAFQGANDGSGPSGLVLGTDGNFYGTSYSGGYNNGNTGAFWKMTPGGVLTATYSFQGNGIADGSGPGGTLVEGTDGNFYGTTIAGSGTSMAGGIIYNMSTVGIRTIIQSFAIGSGRPVGGLLAASDGNMYGMTSSGGTYSDGTVFKLASQSTMSVVYNFGTNAALDGADPVGNVILASDGNLYGATSEIYTNGSKGGSGLVFQLTTQGQMTVLHQFTVGVTFDGNEPATGLIQGPDGNLYGTTYYGGQPDCGIVYEEAITALAPAPVITGLLRRTGTVGTAFPLYQVIASNNPQSYAAAGLPPGLSIDPVLGVITGTPTESGIFPVSISATNSPGGTSSKTLTITVTGPPTITNGPPPNYIVGTPYSFAYQTMSYPAATFSLASGNLPPGLTLSPVGVISGTPTQSGSYPVTVAAKNGITPNATQSFTMTVGQPPTITSAATTTFALGQAGSFTVTAAGTPAPTFSATGLPGWATLDPTTGVISGMPDDSSGSPFTITLTAANGALPNSTQVLTLNVQSPQPFTGNATATPYNDGVPDLLKYLYDIGTSSSMEAADIAAMPTIGMASNGQYVTLTYRQNALITGITVHVQTSTDLQTWTDVANSMVFQVGNDSNNGDPIMQAQVPVTAPAQFMRLNVSQP